VVTIPPVENHRAWLGRSGRLVALGRLAVLVLHGAELDGIATCDDHLSLAETLQSWDLVTPA